MSIFSLDRVEWNLSPTASNSAKVIVRTPSCV